MSDYEMGELRRDRFSELPHSIILHILSLLPMRDVVSTTLLSKGWNNLWTTIPCLKFCDKSDIYNSNRLRNFVNRVLIMWKGTKIQKFAMDVWSDCCMSFDRDLDFWLPIVVGKKVEELHLHICWDEEVYDAPLCLNSCSSLRKLSLLGCNLRMHGSPAWNQLKSLSIQETRISEQLMNQILSGTPQLDDLVLCLEDISENLSILSTSLRYLRIDKYILNEQVKPSLDTVIKICCPNLLILEFSGSHYGKYLLTNVSSLIDATFVFYKTSYAVMPGEAEDELLGDALRQILSSIQRVESVELSFWCIEALGASLKKHSLSPLPNVKFLELNFDRIILGDIVNVLAIFPNLLKLIIDEHDFVYDPPGFNVENFLEFETNLSNSFLLQLKTIEVSSYMCYTSMYQLIGFLLKHANVLEKLVIRAKKSGPETDFLKVEKVVTNMPRSSPTAKVMVDYRPWF